MGIVFPSQRGTFLSLLATGEQLVAHRVGNMREVLDGLVQSTKRYWSDWRHMLVIRLMKIRRLCTVYDSFLFEDE